MAKWNPGKVVERFARQVQQAAARAIRSASPRVPHRDGKAVRGAVGGSLADAALKQDVVEVKRWGAVINWSALGQKFLWFVEGTKRQKARPVPLKPDVPKLVRALERDAVDHYRAAAEGRRQRVQKAARR